MMTSAPRATIGNRLQRTGNLKDLAYEEIKQRLVACQLEPDRLYSTQHFAQLLGVSRTPVREALLRLTNEGFLVCREVKGFQVRQFSRKEMRDVVETRRVIESYVVRRLAGRLQPEDFDHLRHCQKLMTDCAARHDAVGFMNADREFHMYLTRRSGNAHLALLMDNIRAHIALFGLQTLTQEAHAGMCQQVIQEHTRILEALCRPDRRKAVQAMRRHLGATRQRLLGGSAAKAPRRG